MLLTALGFAASAFAQTETNNTPSPTESATPSAAVTTTTASAPAVASTNAVLTLPPPNNTVSGTVTTYNLSTNNAVNLTEEQKEKIRVMLQRAKMSEDQKKRQAELLDKTPVLENKINPGITEKGGIPKRF